MKVNLAHGVGSIWRRIPIDRFLLAIVASAVTASIIPARGSAVPVFDWLTTIVIGILFFLYGARLEPRQALAGLKHWRLHLVIFAFTFLVFPLLGLALRPLSGHGLSPGLYTGLLYLCLVPSTVQSSVNFTSIAKGNVAAALVSATASNLIGVVLTPLLVLLLLPSVGGIHIQASSIGDIVLQLLVPFALGQVSRPLTAGWVSAHRRPLKLVDQGSIIMVVYSAFSAGMREGIWHQVDAASLGLILAIAAAIVGVMLWLTRWVARRLGFNRGDQIAIQFCGTKKSLATGLPMATVLFAGQQVGLIVLPLMIFHQAQLMACGALAARYAKEATPAPNQVGTGVASA